MPLLPGGPIGSGLGSGQITMKARGGNPRGSGLRCHSLMTLATFNCRTLSSEAKLHELEEELEHIKWDVVGLSEVRRRGEEQIELKSGHMFYYKGTVNGKSSGVGFIINKKWKNNIIEVESISDRAARLVIQLTKRYKIQIIQVYAPTISYSDEDIDRFYEEISFLHEKENHYVKVIMGDFNARVGTRQCDECSIGKYGWGERNERGERLVDFAEQEQLFIMNSYFKKNPSRKWTWRNPNGMKHELDYILTNKKHLITDCTVLNQFNNGSDHRMVRCKLYLDAKTERQKLMKQPHKRINVLNLKMRSSAFKIELSNRFAILQSFPEEEEESDITLTNKTITETVMDTALQVAGTAKPQEISKISDRTKKMLEERRKFKVNNTDPTSKTNYAELCKTIRKSLTEDIRQYNCDFIKKTIENNRSLRDAKQHLQIGRKSITSLRHRNGTYTSNRKEIVRTAAEFFMNLYKPEANVNLLESRVIVDDITVTEPEILKEEVEYAIKKMKRGKAPGEDGITIDILKEAGDEIIGPLAQLFTKCLNKRDIPKDWNNAEMILLFKKGERSDIRNYRPISLLPVIYKVFTKVLAHRLQSLLDSAQPKEQAGFRSGFSTIDHIHTIRQLIEKTNEYEMPLCIAFIDYEKAFDSVYTSSVTEALKSVGIPSVYMDLLQNIYKNATATITLNQYTEKIQIKKGVRQGDTISPKLFTAVLETVFQSLDWENKGIKINGEYLSNLRFADDIVLIAGNPEELQTMITELATASGKVGLSINVQKTKVMFNRFAKRANISLSTIELEEVSSYIYLGHMVSLDGNLMDEVNRRIKLGWSAFGRNNLILKGNIPLCLKKKVFNQCILPVLTYGSETWTLTRRMEQRLQTTQRSMERCMLGITRRDKKRNSWVREQTKVTDILTFIKRLKWQWAGHIARREDQRWTTQILDWIPRDHKRPRKRPKARWMDEIRKFGGTGWRHRALDRDAWREIGETFILQWIDNG